MKPFLQAFSRSTTLEDNPLWLVVLCDLMTNLMLFFLILYSFTLQKPENRQEWLRRFEARDLVVPPKELRAAELLREFHEKEASSALTGLLAKAGLEDSTEVSVTERSIRVRLRNQVLFETAQAALADEADRTMALLAKVLKEVPNEVVVEGHTDDVPVVAGPYRTNWELSVARSYAVIERLIREGVPAARLVAAGYGEYHPVAGNDAAAGRSRNRRVEIVILRGRGTEDE